MADDRDSAPELQKSLKSRHMTMISLGGVIGAGLFVGSSAVISETGPASVISYLLAGLLIVLVMRMLGEMAVANPQVGSFAEYARRVAGRLGGLHHRLAVLVLLGDRAGHRGRRRRRDPPALDRPAAVGHGARADGAADRHQPHLGQVVRRVRVLVRRHQGRRHRRVHPRRGRLPVRDRRRRLARPLEPHQPGGLRARGHRARSSPGW